MFLIWFYYDSETLSKNRWLEVFLLIAVYVLIAFEEVGMIAHGWPLF